MAVRFTDTVARKKLFALQEFWLGENKSRHRVYVGYQTSCCYYAQVSPRQIKRTRTISCETISTITSTPPPPPPLNPP